MGPESRSVIPYTDIPSKKPYATKPKLQSSCELREKNVTEGGL